MKEIQDIKVTWGFVLYLILVTSPAWLTVVKFVYDFYLYAARMTGQ